MQESGEMYLETILILQKRGPVRSVDIANFTGFSKPTISEQMKKFREHGYIQMDEKNIITLTPSGQEIAEGVYQKHQLLTSMLIHIGVNKDIAEEDACRMEHYISEETFSKMLSYYEEHMKK